MYCWLQQKIWQEPMRWPWATPLHSSHLCIPLFCLYRGGSFTQLILTEIVVKMASKGSEVVSFKDFIPLSIILQLFYRRIRFSARLHRHFGWPCRSHNTQLPWPVIGRHTHIISPLISSLSHFHFIILFQSLFSNISHSPPLTSVYMLCLTSHQLSGS